MATLKTIILLASIFVFAFSCDIPSPNLGGVALIPSTPTPSEPILEPEPVLIPVKSKRETVMENAIAEIGVREEGGNNRGKRVGEYLASTGLSQGHPWCAAFAKFVFEKSNIPTPGATAWSPSWFPKSKTYWTKGEEPNGMKAGDLFSVYYLNLKRIGHVGIIEKEKDGWITTIEGNTNDTQSREGDVVKRSRRSLKTVHSASNWID